MVQKLKTVGGGLIEAESMIRKATESLASAEADLGASRLNSAVSAAVRAGIQACDAVCLALGGRRSAEPDHSRAVGLLTEIAGGSSEVNQKAKQLQMLLAEKNAADYSIRQPGRDDAERAVKRAKAFHGWSKRQVESATGSG
jgi:uncharacterized protein (UPF0332 family)